MNLNRILPTLAALLLSTSLSALADGYKTVEGVFDYGFAQDVFDIVNIERVGRGIEPLVMTPALTDAAMKRAAELAVYYSHTRPNGSRCFTAIPWVNCAGENIAWGQDSPDWVMFDWMESPGHRENILDSKYKSIGVGCFANEGQIYWVQAFSGGSGASDTRTGTRDVVVDVGTASGLDSIVRDYTIAFVANGGAGTATALKALYGESIRLPANPFVRKGCLFLGWSIDKDGTVQYKNGAIVKNLRTDGGTTTLYAKWAKKNYKVAFYANGGKLPKGKKMSPQTMTYGKAKRLTANRFKAPKGKKFVGWATSKANAKRGVVKYKNKASVKNLVTNGKTVKLYAVWKKK
jgi:uncharacterized repeat protein (TIGR02543 family)